MGDGSRLNETLRRIDAANAEDPNTEIVEGEEQPAALLYGQRMSAWVDTLRPDAPEALRIAARAQHIRRWDIPRSDYPEGRAGYFKWRTTLYAYHGERAGEIMRAVGYDDTTIDRLKFILQKKKLKSDPDVQTLEDAAALVFLEYHLGDFAARDDMTEEKLIDVLQKTWRKMSGDGHEAALRLELPAELQEIIRKALG